MTKIAIRSRVHSYSLLAGVVVGTLFAGLAVPLAFGTTPRSSSSLSGSADPGLPNLEPTSSSAPTTGPGATTGPSATTGGVGPAGTTGGNVGPGGTGGATTGSTGANPFPTVTQGPGGPTKLTASDVGVTASTIKVGFVRLDLTALTPLGLGLKNYDLQYQQQAFDTYVKRLNASGGLYGRKIIVDYVTLNPLDSNGSQSAPALCRKLTEDDKVFLVTGFAGEAGTCAALQHRTPNLFSGSAPREQYDKAHGYIVSNFPTAERMMMDWAGVTTDAGLLNGKKIGLVSTNVSPEINTVQKLNDTLTQLGHAPVYWAKLDPNAGQSQVPVAIQQMRSKGVDTVFLATNFVVAQNWVQSSDSQNYKPRYLASDYGNLSSNGLVDKMTSGFDGAVAYSSAVSEPPALTPEPAPDHACRQEYNAAAGSGKQFAQGEESPLYPICWMAQVIGKAISGAGPTLTRQAVVNAVQSLGPLNLPSAGNGSFSAGKTDFADTLRPLLWHYSCKCYSSAGQPRRVRY